MGDRIDIEARNVETVLLAVQDSTCPLTYYAAARFEADRESRLQRFLRRTWFDLQQKWRKYKQIPELKRHQSGDVWKYEDRPIHVELDYTGRITPNSSCLISDLIGRRVQIMGTPREGHYTLLLVVGRGAWFRDIDQLAEVMRKKAGRDV